MVYELLHKVVSEGVESAVHPNIRETVQAVKAITDRDDCATDDDGNKYATGKRVAEILDLDKSAASRRIKQAREAGYLKNLENRKFQPQKLALADDLPADLEILPKPEKLQEACTEETGCTVAGLHWGERG